MWNEADWSGQEELRRRVLCQPHSTFTSVGGHLAICASLPSGRPEVVANRHKLMALLSYAGMLPSFDGRCGRCPSVHHLNEGVCRHETFSLYVGSVHVVVDVSPWSMPLPCEDLIANTLFLRSRADYRQLICMLQSKVLICDCNSYPD